MKTMIAVSVMVVLLAGPAMAGFGVEDTFSDGVYDVTVSSFFAEYNGQYKYSYTILPTSTANVQWLSIKLSPDVIITDMGVDSGVGEPVLWSLVSGPSSTSADAIFTATVPAGSTSATVWFVSPQSYTFTDGIAAGLNNGQYITAVGYNFLAPIPEPATLTLLLGGMALSLRKRK